MGRVLVAAFGLGMAAVMTGVGLAFVHARGLLERAPSQIRVARAVRLVPAGAAVLVLAVGVVLTTQALRWSASARRYPHACRGDMRPRLVVGADRAGERNKHAADKAISGVSQPASDVARHRRVCGPQDVCRDARNGSGWPGSPPTRAGGRSTSVSSRTDPGDLRPEADLRVMPAQELL